MSEVFSLLNPQGILTTILGVVNSILKVFKLFFQFISDIFTGKINFVDYIKNFIKKFEDLVKSVISSFV